MDIAAPYVAAMLAIAGVSVLTEWHYARRRRHPVTRRIRRLAAKHAGKTGLVVQVFWPVSLRGARRGVDTAEVSEPKRFRGRKLYFFDVAEGRRRATWSPIKPGGHIMNLVEHGLRPQEDKLAINFGAGETVVLLCWPAKRRVITPERARTEWAVHRLQ